MATESPVKIWLAQTRANFLLLAVFLVFIGWALAWKYLSAAGYTMNWSDAILILIGAVLTHASVNLFNEHSDFHTGIDYHTLRNPFSGGSGMLTSGKTRAGQVLLAAVGALAVAAAIGVYFTITAHWSIALIALVGAFAIVFYTNFLAKIMLGEFFAGLTLGTLVVVGTFVALVAKAGPGAIELYPLEMILISIPPGILTFQLLFLNEFPDADADLQGGRKHLVITLGHVSSAKLYIALLALTYLVILVTPFVSTASNWVLLGLLTIPMAIKASKGTLANANSKEGIIPVMAVNVGIVLLTDVLLALGVFLGVLLG